MSGGHYIRSVHYDMIAEKPTTMVNGVLLQFSKGRGLSHYCVAERGYASMHGNTTSGSPLLQQAILHETATTWLKVQKEKSVTGSKGPAHYNDYTDISQRSKEREDRRRTMRLPRQESTTSVCHRMCDHHYIVRRKMRDRLQ